MHIFLLQAYRPSNGEYCDLNDLQVDSCRWKHKCSDITGARYSFTKQSCYTDDGLTNTGLPYDNDRFMVYETFTFDTAGETGRMYFPIIYEEYTWMRSGNVFGFNRRGGYGRLKAVDSSPGDTRFTTSSTVDIRQGQGRGYEFLFRAVVDRRQRHLIRAVFPMNWPLGVHDVSASLSNNINVDVGETPVILIDALYNVTMDAPDYGKLAIIGMLCFCLRGHWTSITLSQKSRDFYIIRSVGIGKLSQF